MFNSQEKLPWVGTTIFTVMTALANEYKAINLAQGFPGYNPDPTLMERLSHYALNGWQQYAPMTGVPELRQALTKLIEHKYAKKIDSEDEITITAGATEAIFSAITAFICPNDEVIIIEPAYDSYKPAIELCGAKAVPYTMQSPEFSVIWEDLEALITRQTKLIIINSPHNPTGKILSHHDMVQLTQLATKHNLLVISDEAYEHLVFDNAKHEGALLYPELWERTLTVSSLGKTFNNTGWRLGYLVANKKLTAQFRRIHQYVTFCSPTPLQMALADYINLGFQPVDNLSAFYQEKRDRFLQLIAPSRLKPLHTQGSFFQLLDYSAVSSLNDLDFCKELVIKHGVACIPISPFISSNSQGQQDKVIRICFAKPDEILVSAASKLIF